MDTIHTALQAAVRRLKTGPSPRLDAEVLLACVLNVSRTHLYAWPEKKLSPAQAADFQALVARRAAGEPVAYLTGQREFHSLPLQVTPAVLIPRPETELLVEVALDHLPADGRVVDLGTGSGAVALAMARQRPGCEIIATDRSPAALQVAQTNARQLHIHIHWVAADWLAAFAPLRARLIVSNPPYIRAHDPHLRQGDVRYEPRQALVAGEDGLMALRYIIAAARAHLQPQGWLWLEHGYDQEAAVQALLRRHGYAAIATHRDLAGLPRVSGGRMR